MTEYWQSQARKFCDFCKCWLADNKVSISFHENGKKHKENVKKHISQLSKKSAKEFKQQEKLEDEMKKMEEAAMAAYMKDVQNNADLTSQNINSMLGAPLPGSSESPQQAAAERPSPAPLEPSPPSPPPLWHEVKHEGGSYFWNTETNETRWDPPDQYLSIAQQEEQKLKDKKKDKLKEHKKKEQHKEKMKELKAHVFREQMRELAAPAAVSAGPPRPSSPSTPATPAAPAGPAPRAAPYGSWTAVPQVEPSQVDFQLPKVRERAPPPVVVEPERVTFKEKRVESLGEGPVEFKKRKFNSKRNMRQKTNDD